MVISHHVELVQVLFVLAPKKHTLDIPLLDKLPKVYCYQESKGSSSVVIERPPVVRIVVNRQAFMSIAAGVSASSTLLKPVDQLKLGLCLSKFMLDCPYLLLQSKFRMNRFATINRIIRVFQ